MRHARHIQESTAWRIIAHVDYCKHVNAVGSVKEVPQAEAKGKPASEAPMTPSAWKGTQVCQFES